MCSRCVTIKTRVTGLEVRTARFIGTHVRREKKYLGVAKTRYLYRKLGRLSEKWIGPWAEAGSGEVDESMTGSAKVDREIRHGERTIAWSVMGFSSERSLENEIRDSGNCLWK